MSRGGGRGEESDGRSMGGKHAGERTRSAPVAAHTPSLEDVRFILMVGRMYTEDEIMKNWDRWMMEMNDPDRPPWERFFDVP